MNPWLDRPARKLVTESVRDIEAKTSAEIVVTVCPASSSYLHVDLACGALLAAIALALYVFLPVTFPDDMGVLGVLVAFLFGAVVSNGVAPLKRRLVRTRTFREAVRRASCAVFVDQGLSRTRKRTGILVFVSLFEREVSFVPDVGVAIDVDFGAAVADVEDVVRKGGTPEEFAQALRRFGALLAKTMPIEEGDVNELPDSVVA